AFPNTRIYGIAGAKVASDGTFHLADLAPDRYRVKVRVGSSGLFLKAVRMGSHELPGQLLELGASAEIEVVLSTRTRTAPGVVRLEGSGQPADGATVVLIPKEKERREDLDAYVWATADETGRFTFGNVVPGEYQAYAWESLRVCCAYMDPD